MSTIESIRSEFPALAQTVYGKPLVYLDNAATSQRPKSVLDKLEEMSARTNANIHRAVHKLASDATAEYEAARDAVKDFIGARSREEIIFTSGTTGSLNLLAFCLGEAFIKPGDEILIAQSEHHSDIVPWQLMAGRKGAFIKVLPVDDDGHLMVEKLPELAGPRTRIACVAQVSNVLGLKNPVKEIVNYCHSIDCITVVDGAQGIVHGRVGVQEMGCDFYAFSGHKMYAATGTGVLYGRKEVLEQLPPYMGGGEMIQNVSFEKTTYAPLPARFEAGTQNIAAVPTYIPAIDFIRRTQSADIQREERAITAYVTKELTLLGARIYGVPRNPEEKLPIFSFTIEGVHHEDLALILDKMGIAVRSGQMCAEPLMDRYGVSGMLRASFAPYNTATEAENFIECLGKAVKMLK